MIPYENAGFIDIFRRFRHCGGDFINGRILTLDNIATALVPFSRPSGRTPQTLRVVSIETGVAKHAEGSALVKFGDTHVLCTATVEERVPGWMKNTGKGWITAEYGMLPRSTHQRIDREAAKGRQSGRTQEIQRLIGRALRSVVDMGKMGERQIRIDCDVIQADGGTRTASITGAYVALYMAFEHIKTLGLLKAIPFHDSVAAISCGIWQGTPVLDLDYAEDSEAETDANFVLTGAGKIVELQGTAERDPFDEKMFLEMLNLARQGCSELSALQKKVLGL